MPKKICNKTSCEQLEYPLELSYLHGVYQPAIKIQLTLTLSLYPENKKDCITYPYMKHGDY